ncbi:MAG: helix-turn-helix domain-containing protein [Campylobacteraceae bacterium]
MANNYFNSTIFSSKIKNAREKLKYTQQDLASKSNISIQSIKQYESSKGNITIENLYKLSNALNIDISYFLNDDEKLLQDKNSLPFLDVKTLTVQKVKNEEKPKEQGAFVHKNTKSNILDIIIVSNVSTCKSDDINFFDSFDTDKTLPLSSTFFEDIKDKNTLRAFKIEEISKTLNLPLNSWVISKKTSMYEGDGFYILTFENTLVARWLKLSSDGLKVVSLEDKNDCFAVNFQTSPLKIFAKVVKSIV